MTKPTSWPDPARPGLPPAPDQDGLHLLLTEATHGASGGAREAARWSSGTREWWLPGSTLPKSPGWAATFCSYLSAVRTEDDLRAAYERGVADGRQAAMAAVAQAQDEAVRAALHGRDAELRLARREGAETMRTRAADVAQSNDPNMLADRLRTFRLDEETLDLWHRRLHVAAILALPLPGDE